ncbi:C-type lectin domain family 4 member K-like [Drosophila ficusphila]|uniref:C-type lectin domain family 4 member K-like n=1 Tax=Drosophila ficusphila TaxID=30025 RepID=UPI0007E8B37B|nr:C-type lectin domain family 4 member K-like [Drosophila ficusphila]
MLKAFKFCLVLFLSWNFYGSLAEDSSVCLLHDSPNQCGAFCLEALKPLLDHIAFQQKKLNETQAKLDQREASCENAISHELQTKLEAIENQRSAMQELLSKVNKKLINTHPYVRIGSRLIYVESKNPRNWEQAEAFCRGINGHLITIQNDSELSALNEKLKRSTSYWLGITDVAKEGEFVSVASGKPPAFLKWFSSQPDNYNGNQNCVVLNDSKMWDSDCSYLKLFVCEATFD